MNVLWISHFYPYPPAGGALQRSYHLLREVAKRHRVHLVTLRKERNRPAHGSSIGNYPRLEEFCQRVDVFPIRSERYPWGRFVLLLSGLWSSHPYDDRWLANRNMEHYLESDLEPHTLDVVHLDTLGLARYGQYFKASRLIMNHHNIESHMMDRRADEASFLPTEYYLRAEARKLSQWERRWCGLYAENLVVSSLDGERLQEVAPEASWTVVPNGVDTDYFRPKDLRDVDGEGLVFVGRMSWYPNRDAVAWLLSEIWPELLKDNPARTLTLVGSSPPRELVRESGQSKVRVTGFVPDVRPYIDKAQIYVCPIRTGGGTRLKILDAMAMGIPIVATRMSVEGLELQESRHYLRAETAQEFVEAVTLLENNREVRLKLAKGAREEAVKRFSWPHVGELLNRAYENAIGEQ